MAVSSPQQWQRFDQVGIDLSDVLGTPGLPEPAAFAERVSREFKAEWRQVPASSEAQFVVGDPVGLLQGSAQTKLTSFLSRVGEGVPEADLGAETCTVRQEIESAYGSHLSAQQRVRETEVLGARFKIHLVDDKAYAITGRPVGNMAALDPGDRPATSDAAVIEAVRHHFDLPKNVPVKKVSPIIVPIDGHGIWAYKTRFLLDEPPSDVRAFIRSDDLSLALSFNVASAYLHGEAKIYGVNPLRTPNPTIGRLDYIGPATPDVLSGSVVEVRPRVGQAITEASRDFRNVVAPGLDEVQTYYHLCAGVRYFRSLFEGRIFDQSPFGPIRATVHDPRAQNNAYFIPSTGRLQFGDFDDRPSARSGDVILHELGHAVTDRVCSLGRGPADGQGRGLSEGYSDYFAASALASPLIADYVTSGGSGMRDCSRKGLRFQPAFMGSEHETGEVWASVLWSIRSECGVGVADMLAAESLQFLDSRSTFEHGRAALLTADRAIFPGGSGLGRHADVIAATFDERAP